MENELSQANKELEDRTQTGDSESQKKTLNQKIEENFALKQIIDQKRAELEKQKKKYSTLEELL